MPSTKEFLDYVLEKTLSLKTIKYRKMFGEYAIYFNSKVIGFICDNDFFLKITSSGENYLKNKNIILEKDYPYPGAKLYFLASDLLEDEEAICEFIKETSIDILVKKNNKVNK